MFGHGIIDGDDGEFQRAFRGHGAQADHTGRRFFRAAAHAGDQIGAGLVNRTDQIGAVIHGDTRLVIQCRVDMLIVDIIRLATNRIDRYSIMFHQCGRHIIVGAEWIAGAEHHIGTRGLQCACEVGGFRGDMQAAADADTSQRAPRASSVFGP